MMWVISTYSHIGLGKARFH